MYLESVYPEIYKFPCICNLKLNVFSMFILKDFPPKPIYHEFWAEVSFTNLKPNDHPLTIEVVDKKTFLA